LARYVRRGEVVVVGLDPTLGTEIRKSRPCVIISNDAANEFSPQLTVLPVTEYHARKARLPVCVALERGVGGLDRPSVVLCAQIRAVDKERITGAPLGCVDPDNLRRIEQAVKLHLGLT
jgi:mRNA interferase MazF